MTTVREALERVVAANERLVTLELPAGAVQLLYDVLGHFPHDPGRWPSVARGRCSEALTSARPSSGLNSPTIPCGCAQTCGDDGDTEGPGTCKGLPRARPEPLVEVVLVDRRAEPLPPRGVA